LNPIAVSQSSEARFVSKGGKHMPGSLTNQSGETLLVYGPQRAGDTHDNSLYHLPTGNTTPAGWDCDGLFIPNDRYATQAIMSDRRGPVAVKYINLQAPTITRTNDRYHCEFNFSVLAPGEVNWEISNIAFASVPGNYPAVPGARPVPMPLRTARLSDCSFAIGQDGPKSAVLMLNEDDGGRLYVHIQAGDRNADGQWHRQGSSLATLHASQRSLESMMSLCERSPELTLTYDLDPATGNVRVWWIAPAGWSSKVLSIATIQSRTLDGDATTRLLGYDDIPFLEDMLNEQEKALFREDPIIGVRVLYAGKTATDASVAMYQSACLHNGNGDAFQACLLERLDGARRRRFRGDALGRCAREWRCRQSPSGKANGSLQQRTGARRDSLF
jgi:hypothetical protein